MTEKTSASRINGITQYELGPAVQQLDKVHVQCKFKALRETQLRCLCALSPLPSAQSVQVYWITLTSLHTLTHLLSSGKSWETERQNLLSTSTNSSTSACLGCTERKRVRQADRHTEKGYLLFKKKKAENLWIGVWICMRERELCLPVEWRRGSGASFCLPDLQMALWTQVSNGDVKECRWDSHFSHSLV